MVLRVALIVSLFMTGFAAAESCKPERVAEPQFLTVSLVEQGTQKKVLAETALQVPPDRVLNSFSGGELPPIQGEAGLEFGVQVSGKIKPVAKSQFRIALKLQVGNRVESPDSETQVVRTQTVEIRSDLTTDVTKRIHCGGQQWLELRLE
ncbi:MAG: hypothetical protein KDA77_01965 [Planctomycetaceae bacterium]|nr:hypothetical protein [Planctomycetaceae bacterium]